MKKLPPRAIFNFCEDRNQLSSNFLEKWFYQDPLLDVVLGRGTLAIHFFQREFRQKKSKIGCEVGDEEDEHGQIFPVLL